MSCTCACCCGACCDNEGNCTVTLESECLGPVLEFQGKGTTCDPNPCGCVTNDDCCTTGYTFTQSGTVYGPYDTAAECASASAATCTFPSPPCPCICEAIDPYCCDGTCQDTPCEPP